MVEAGQAQVPVGGGEGGWATEHIIHHKKLGTVEDDPGDVAEEEDNDNADEDSGQVYLTTSMLVSLCVSESELRYNIRIIQHWPLHRNSNSSNPFRICTALQ